MMNMATTTAAGMSMSMDMPAATSTSSMSMGDSDESMMMSMADMTMTFFDSIKTPLFSNAWAPTTTGQYAGTCIFLIFLAGIFRVLIAFRPVLEASVWRGSRSVVGTHSPGEDADKSGLPRYPSQYGWITFRSELRRRWTGWRASAATGRACYELVIAGIGYLLMIAVMTMNTGYFLSVLAGVFLGTFLLGGLAHDVEDSARC
ncbi:unnamed protein product [Clonostachys byssicola]|uniref:Copper transport protein n=1 Tax=Clonostachys byssicola TaxID=160290 RepID=A0A9N9XWF1_9HYPO|nr:unnamed protein product [Clonostachys byssicola]